MLGIDEDTLAEASGFFRFAEDWARCGLCLQRGETWANSLIIDGDWIREMPRSWRPRAKWRLAHRGCVEKLVEEIRLKTGINVVL